MERGDANYPGSTNQGDEDTLVETSRSSIKRRNNKDGDGPEPKKSRRRIFSCKSCQKRKCKCDYDAALQSCRQCQTLRLECSLRGEYEKLPPPPVVEDDRVPIYEIELSSLQNHEKALNEIKAMLNDLRNNTNSNANPHNDAERPTHREHRQESILDTHRASLNDIPDPNPADNAVSSAPVIVLREIGLHCSGEIRRSLVNSHLDLVLERVVNEELANDLIRLFFHFQDHSSILFETKHMIRSQELRHISPFLHSVCCLQGIMYRKDLCGSTIHRQVYERVRNALGQALLASPLRLEEIYAALLMSDGATDPAGGEREYIDSWLLTGYCAKQAMLSISFSKIVSRIKEEKSTTEDRKAIRLWSTICLQHLRWSITTGRPPNIGHEYMDHCNFLLSFYDASSEDGMLLAEILLYNSVSQRLAKRPFGGPDSNWEDFSIWKLRWKHLLSLPTAPRLRFSYYTARLILLIRALEEFGEDLQPRSFLKPDRTNDFDDPIELTRQGSNDDQTRSLRSDAAKYAQSILETFLVMDTAVRASVTLNTCLCLAYCSLLLAHYKESQSGLSDEHSLGLVERLNDWGRNAPGRTWARISRFGNLAKQKLRARIQSRHQRSDRDLKGAVGTFGDREHVRDHREKRVEIRTPSSSTSVGPASGVSFEDIFAELFPSMEEFFGGGFLEFP